jgi:phage gp29-like protein
MQDMFVLAMKKYLDNISNVINNEAIPLLLRANGMDERYAPRLVHEGLDTDSIGVFVDALVKCVQSGVVVPTKGLQRTVLTKMRASTVEADAAWEKTEELQDKLIEATERQAEADLKNTQAPAPSAADSGPTGKTKQQSLQKSKEMEYVTIEGSEYLLREGVLFQIEEN